MPSVTFAADDARPYALGLLFAVLSSSLLLRLCAHPRYRTAAQYALTGAAMVDMQLLYGAVLLAHLSYAALQWRRGKMRGIGYAGAAAALLAALTLPLALQMRSVGALPEVHS